jgi:hypothetical protein
MMILGRLVLMLPPLALFLSAVALLGLSPAAWGAGEHVGLPAWMTTVGGLGVAAPGVAIGTVCLVRIWASTGEPFYASMLQLSFGLIMFLVSAAAELALALRISDSATYDSLRDTRGNVSVSPSGFLAITFIVGWFFGAWTAVAGYLYSAGIMHDLQRFEHGFDEPDPIGDMLRGRRRDPWDF